MQFQMGDYIINLMFSDLLIFAALFIILTALVYAKIKLAKTGQITRSLNMVILQISVAKNLEKQSQDKREEQKECISIMEQLFASLSNIREEMMKKIIYGPFYLSFEIATPIDSKEIFFYVSVPKKFQSIIEKQINSFYQDAEIKRVDDYNIFVPNGGSAASYMTLKKRHIFPIKTYQQLETDPLLNITNVFSKIPNGEGAALQVIIKPIGNVWQKASKDAIKLMQKGKGFESGHVESSFVMKAIKEFTSIISVSNSKTDEQKKQEELQINLTPEQEETIKAVETKSTKIGFETNVRLIASAQTKEKARILLKELENSFSQFNAPNLNSFKITETFLNKVGFLNKTIYNFIFRNFEKSRKIILNTEELASIFHFPIATTETPQIKWLKAKQAPPPNNIVSEGLVLGHNTYRGDDTKIKIGRDDRRRHMYTIGQTGTGKSALLGELIKQDIKNGEGVCVIDPHGDLVEAALECVPKERADDVILFDPSNTQKPLDSGSTLIEISKVLADADFRKYKLSKCQNYIVKNFWQKEAEKAGGEAALANMVPYITSKLTQFISNDTMRPIIGQQKSSINFREIMDNRKIILVNLSKGKIGEMNAYLLGLVIVGKILVSSLSRTDIPQEERKDFYLYIDEFQNFTTDSISTILSEARKYRLILNIAHQFLGQLPEEIQKSVFGNVGTLISFRIGPEDAEFMAKQFVPNFNEQDLINIDNYNAYVKLMISGTISEGFNMATYPPEKGSRELAEAIKQLSMLKYGKDREIVEREIRERSEIGVK
jgi:hypothetical protein